VNNVVKCAIQEICKKLDSGYYGSFDAMQLKQLEKNGIRTIGDKSKINLAGIIDYDHQLKVAENPNIEEPIMPVIRESDQDQEEDDVEHTNEVSQQQLNREEEDKEEEEPMQETKHEKEKATFIDPQPLK
jgi:hypothetical protein